MQLHKITSMKKLAIISCALILALGSCSKKDSEEPLSLPPGPQDTVTNFSAYFYNVIDSTTEVASCDDPDGPGPLEASIGGIALQKNSNYIITFRIEDATGNTSVMLDKKIKANGKDFKICLNNPLGSNVHATDSDGSNPIGLENAMSTSNITGNDKITFTIKYQKGVKNGQCEPGIVYYTCSVPVTIY